MTFSCNEDCCDLWRSISQCKSDGRNVVYVNLQPIDAAERKTQDLDSKNDPEEQNTRCHTAWLRHSPALAQRQRCRGATGGRIIKTIKARVMQHCYHVFLHAHSVSNAVVQLAMEYIRGATHVNKQHTGCKIALRRHGARNTL